MVLFLNFLELLPLALGKSSMPDTVDSVVTCHLFVCFETGSTTRLGSNVRLFQLNSRLANS